MSKGDDLIFKDINDEMWVDVEIEELEQRLELSFVVTPDAPIGYTNCTCGDVETNCGGCITLHP